MKEADILLWAAGATKPIPRLDGVNDDRLLYLLGIDEAGLLESIQEHRLLHRFSDRAMRERLGWCTRPLMAQLWRLAAGVEARFAQQLAALREIREAMPSDGPPVILVKGCSTYAVTGERRALRPSIDLDLFAEDPESLHTLLQRLGYSGERLTRHEFAIMQRGRVTIEIHRHFPVLSYPVGVAGVDLDPMRHPGIWRQPSPVRPRVTADGSPWLHRARRESGHADLAEFAVRGVTADTADLTVTDATMSAFILCAHAFRDWIEPPFRRAVPIPLAVLADVSNLTVHPHFDRERFLQLVDRFAGHDSVQFVNTLLTSLLAANPLPLPGTAGGALGPLPAWSGRATGTVAAPGSDQPRKRFWALPWARPTKHASTPPALPRALSFDGCWAGVGYLEDAVNPPALRLLVERLGASELAATNGPLITPPPRHCTTLSPDCPLAPIERFLVQSQNDVTPGFGIAAHWGQGALTFTIRLHTRMEHGHRYDVRFGDGRRRIAHHWAVIEPDGTLAVGCEADDESVAHWETQAGTGCRVSFPWVTLPRWWRAGASLPAVIHLTQYLPLPDPDVWETDPVIVIPLIVLRPALAEPPDGCAQRAQPVTLPTTTA